MFNDEMERNRAAAEGRRYMTPGQQRLHDWWVKQMFKIYIVTLTHTRGKKPDDVLVIRINNAVADSESNRLRAARVALRESIHYSPANIKGVGYRVRLAHPRTDLGCVWTGDPDKEPEI